MMEMKQFHLDICYETFKLIYWKRRSIRRAHENKYKENEEVKKDKKAARQPSASITKISGQWNKKVRNLSYGTVITFIFLFFILPCYSLPYSLFISIFLFNYRFSYNNRVNP